MKTLITLLLTCMISLSLMAQQEIKELQKQPYSKKYQQSFTAFEKKMDKHPKYASKHLSMQFKAIQRTSLKADQADEQKMDSILWDLYDTNTTTWSLSDRELFSYNGNGDMVNYVWFAFDTLEMKILPFNKEQVQYEAQMKPTMFYLYEWDKLSGQWVYVTRFELIYDGQGNLSQEKVYDWDGSQWLIAAQFDMTYDGEGNMLSELWSLWNDDSSKLVLTFKDEYIYEGGKLTTWNEYYMVEGIWEHSFLSTYTYAGGNLISEVTQGWDFFTEDWGDYSQTLYTYNEADLVIMEEIWGFDRSQFMMVRESLFDYTWDADRNRIVEVESEWDEEAGAVKSWNSVAGSWQHTWKSEWSFNKNFTVFQLYVPYWFQSDDGTDLEFVHMPVSELGYLNNNGTWDLNYRQTAYYSDFGGSTGMVDVYDTRVSVFPNPANDMLTFKWEKDNTSLNLELYDLTGKQVVSQSIENNETIGVDNLSRGMYLYKLKDNNEIIQTGKISLR